MNTKKSRLSVRDIEKIRNHLLRDFCNPVKLRCRKCKQPSYIWYDGTGYHEVCGCKGAKKKVRKTASATQRKTK